MTYSRTSEEAAEAMRYWHREENWPHRPLALRSAAEQRAYWLAQGKTRFPIWHPGEGFEPDLRPGWEARDLMNTPEYEESERRKDAEQLRRAGL